MSAAVCRSLLQSLQVKTESSQKNKFFYTEFALTNSTWSCVYKCVFNSGVVYHIGFFKLKTTTQTFIESRWLDRAG